MSIDLNSALLKFAREIAPTLTEQLGDTPFGRDNSECSMDCNDPEFAIVVVVARSRDKVKAIFGAANAILGIEVK